MARRSRGAAEAVASRLVIVCSSPPPPPRTSVPKYLKQKSYVGLSPSEVGQSLRLRVKSSKCSGYASPAGAESTIRKLVDSVVALIQLYVGCQVKGPKELRLRRAGGASKTTTEIRRVAQNDASGGSGRSDPTHDDEAVMKGYPGLWAGRPTTSYGCAPTRTVIKSG